MEKLTLTVRETAQLLGVSLDVIYSLTQDETSGFPWFYIGKRIKVDRVALENWVKEKSASSEKNKTLGTRERR
jgi:excisionase family DNA binding protein